jgi:hypothetical protein
MSNRDDDKLLKEKLESLSPLQGGIVFGKDEAWDRLQARLDKKPLALPLARWKMAAAAAVLLLLTGGVIWRITCVQNDVPTTGPVAAQPAAAAAHTAAVQAPATAGPGPQAALQAPAIAEMHHIVKTEPAAPQPGITITTDTYTAPLVVAPAPAPITTAVAQKEMEVVSIGDLERINIDRHSAARAQPRVAAHADFNKMPVNYIGDVEQAEQEVEVLARQTRKPIIRNIFAPPVYHEQEPRPADDYAQTHHFLKGILAIQD